MARRLITATSGGMCGCAGISSDRPWGVELLREALYAMNVIDFHNKSDLTSIFTRSKTLLCGACQMHHS